MVGGGSQMYRLNLEQGRSVVTDLDPYKWSENHNWSGSSTAWTLEPHP